LSEETTAFYKEHTSAYEGDSGIDLFFPETVSIPSSYTSTIIGLDISCRMLDEDGNEVSYWLLPRSSIAKTTLRMSNSVGLIDASYRGEIKVPVDNLGPDKEIMHGDRLFQIAAPNLAQVRVKLVAHLDDTERGSQGFGSSGK
jgi:dUTP pyrophosphatase